MDKLVNFANRHTKSASVCEIDEALFQKFMVKSPIWDFNSITKDEYVKAHYNFSFIGSSLSTGFQVYLSKCLDPYVSPGCTIRFLFFCSFSALFQHVDLVTTSLGSKSPSLSPGFCVRRPRLYDLIC